MSMRAHYLILTVHMATSRYAIVPTPLENLADGFHSQ